MFYNDMDLLVQQFHDLNGCMCCDLSKPQFDNSCWTVEFDSRMKH